MKKIYFAFSALLIAFFVLTSQALAVSSLDDINQRICNRFEEDAARLAAIMEELRSREGIIETRVAFGGVDTQIESADYAITYAAEAIAYQRAQKYSSVGQLRSSLGVLRGKILKAKNEVGKALNE